MILNIIKKSFAQVCKNPAITLFPVLYLILICLFAPYIYVLPRIYSLIIVLCMFFLTVLFFGGWFQLLSEITEDTEKSAVGIFFEGAGKNIIPSAILTVFYFVTLAIVTYYAGQIALKFFGNPAFIFNGLIAVAKDNTAFMDYFNNLSRNDLLLLFAWQIVMIGSLAVYHFLIMFLPASLIKTDGKNAFMRPFLAISDNFAFIFKNFGFSLLVYLFICLCCFGMTLIKCVAYIHIVLSILFIILNLYFISWVVMIIFNCYEQKNSCIDGSDSIGEDQDSDSTGESE